MSWGPEKMLIRCSKESQHPAEWTPGPRLSIWGRERHNVDGHKFGGQNITVYVRSPAPSHTQTLNNPFEPLQIKWEVNIFIKKFFSVFIIASVYLLYRYDAVDEYITAPDRALSMGQIELNCILILNWIVWIRTVWQNWIAWNRNVFEN